MVRGNKGEATGPNAALHYFQRLAIVLWKNKGTLTGNKLEKWMR